MSLFIEVTFFLKENDFVRIWTYGHENDVNFNDDDDTGGNDDDG